MRSSRVGAGASTELSVSCEGKYGSPRGLILPAPLRSLGASLAMPLLHTARWRPDARALQSRLRARLTGAAGAFLDGLQIGNPNVTLAYGWIFYSGHTVDERSELALKEIRMNRKTSLLLAAAVAAATTSVGALANDTFPLSVNESGPVYAQHERAPVNVGASRADAAQRQLSSQDARSGAIEVQTPASVSESAPWLTGTGRR